MLNSILGSMLVLTFLAIPATYWLETIINSTVGGVRVIRKLRLIDVKTSQYFDHYVNVRGFRLWLATKIVTF